MQAHTQQVGGVRLSHVALVVALLGAAHAQSPVAKFRLALSRTRGPCLRESRLGTLSEKLNTCERVRPAFAPSVGELVQKVPDGMTSINIFGRGPTRNNINEAIELCAVREGNGRKSWKSIERTRIELLISPVDEHWKECKAQMDAEKQDCKRIAGALCAFTRGEAFECVPPQQRTLTARTLEDGDDCQMLKYYAQGRPVDWKEHRDRLRESKSACANDKDTIALRCGRRDQKLSEIMSSLPPRPYNFNLELLKAKETELEGAINDCVLMETPQQYSKLRLRAVQAIRDIPRRTACLQALHNDYTKRCKAVNDLMCAHSYGVDLSCKPPSQSFARTSNACADVVASIAAEQQG